ncbi:MAG: MerR family transcriptional regulator [Patescibacteria group bacterium]|nr:MerR family transcriptional regulator [Patescibacteria group bacterium]
MRTISQLARMFNLSRSSLLYYDSIGLLTPDKRTLKNYRLYSDGSAQKLGSICELRDTGLPLKSIKMILSDKRTNKDFALRKRLHAINQEISGLRKQQQVIVKILRQKGLSKRTRFIGKDQWVAFLRSAGLDDLGMKKWHVAFERSLPECHQDFLESIGLSDREIKTIRAASK